MTDQLNQILVDTASGLSYRLRPGRAGQGPAPCLVLLHGVGANEAGFIDLARQMAPELTVVLVRGPLEFGAMSYGWFQVQFTQNGPVINPAQADASRQKLQRLVEQLPPLHGVDPARIWIAGFSQGGIMSASVGLTAPDKVAGFGILSGRILPEVLPLVQRNAALREAQAFVSHGVQDDKLGIHFARQSRQVLEELGVPLAYHEYQASHTLNGAMLNDFNRWLGAQIGDARNTNYQA